MNKQIQVLSEQVIKDPGYQCSRADTDLLLSTKGPDVFDMIFFAGKIRENYKGNVVFSCSIINAKSGHCSEDCAYCAQSGHHHTGVPVYPMLDQSRILETALRMEGAGATHFSMVMSGFTPGSNDLDRVCSATEQIRQKTGLRVCASLGVLTGQMAQKLKDAGISNYHHNLETAESYFDRICTTHQYADDINTVKAAKAAGFVVCSGGIMGLGESWDQRLELALTLKDLDVDTIPINFLNPIPGTRLADRPLVSPLDALKSIALFRFIHPDKNITICGGREVTLKDFQSWMFAAGSNALMSGDYLTTKGRSIKEDMAMIEDLGFEIKP
ncbi:MAG: biotin synthase BioB [Pseudomonadota bacterium]